MLNQARRRLEILFASRLASISQAGQDQWVYSEVFNEKHRGYFVDIGAHDGLFLSNTFLLERRYGWQGLLVEANPKTFGQLTQTRRATCIQKCVDREAGKVIFKPKGVFGGIVAEDTDNKPQAENLKNTIEVDALPLDQLLRDYKAPSVIDYLSMDIEGAEERALSGFDFSSFVFRSITLERPSAPLRRVLDKNDYIVVKDIPELDTFYIHKSHIENYRENLLAFYEKRYAVARLGSRRPLFKKPPSGIS